MRTKYDTKSKEVSILVTGISRRQKTSFKRKYKGLLKGNGLSLRDFYKQVFIVAMKNPAKFI